MSTLTLPRKKDDALIPIPAPVMAELSMIDTQLSRGEREREERRVIRRVLATTSFEELNEPSLFEIYSARIWKIIREVMAEA